MNKIIILLLCLAPLAMLSVGASPPQDGLKCCPQPTLGDHFWNLSAEITMTPGQTLGLSLLPGNVSSTGQPNGAIIQANKTLVITRALWIGGVGAAPNLARLVQATGASDVLIFGPEMVTRFIAGANNGGISVTGDATLALRNQSTTQSVGRLSLSGYWVPKT